MKRERSVWWSPVGLLGIAGAASAVLLVAIVWLALAHKVNTTFNITVETERVDFARAKAAPARWVIENVDLVDGNREQKAVVGAIELGPSVKGFVQRIAFGPLWVHLECPAPCKPAGDKSTGSDGTASESAAFNDGPSIGRLFNEQDEPRPLGSPVEVFIEDLRQRADQGSTVIFPLAGDVISGRAVGVEVLGSTAILRGGTVALLDSSVLGNNIFESRRVDLLAGDQFVVADRDPKSETYGFVVADERPALTAAYRIVGARAKVIRPGGGEYPVSASLFDHLRGDDVFQVVSASLALVATFASIIAFIMGLPEQIATRVDGGMATVGPLPAEIPAPEPQRAPEPQAASDIGSPREPPAS